MTALISVSPNPFTDLVKIRIDYENKKNTHYIIWLIDRKGKIVKMSGVTLEAGITTIELDRLQNLPAGTFRLDIKDMEGKSIYSARMVKD